MMRADLAVAAVLQRSHHVRRSRVGRDRISDDVRRADTMSCEQGMEARQRVDVLKGLIRPGGCIPLIVAFGVDSNE